MQSWKNLNAANFLIKFHDDEDWKYIFSTHRNLINISDALFENLERIEKADLFRYLITFLEGGIYSDADVECLLPVTQWLTHYNINTSMDKIDFLFGIEFSRPQTKYNNIGRLPFQLSQFTFAVCRQSKLMAEIIKYVGGSIATVPATSSEAVLERTGPAIFTKAVVDTIAKYGHPNGTNKFGYPHAIAPRSDLNARGQVLHLWMDSIPVVGVILPYDAFSFHAMHHSTKAGPALTQHNYEGSWRRKKNKKKRVAPS